MTKSMETLTAQFAQQQDKNEIVEILKELFDENKLKMITDLEPDEIKLLTKMLVIAKMKDIEAWNDVSELFMILMLSKNRKSRAEIIEGVKGYYQRISGFSKLLPTNWGRRGIP